MRSMQLPLVGDDRFLDPAWLTRAVIELMLGQCEKDHGLILVPIDQERVVTVPAFHNEAIMPCIFATGNPKIANVTRS